ncbi:unnamed protein product [Adineta ricciae]|uniref:Uncharacterized protein n=1 Tax=Adineta ricciae TaxID=249248 RepID=A0A816FD33_ADIRI|nr:unnamed protein product [Adineta ricciae]
MSKQNVRTDPLNNIEFINYNAALAYKTEIILKDKATHRTWTTKYEPWLSNEYHQMYDRMAKVHGISRENDMISVKRPEWQQSSDVLPPVNQRLCGQRRQRIPGAFPQTMNDMIGWRVLPTQAVEVYGSTTAAYYGNPIEKRLKLSNWPIESLN